MLSIVDGRKIWWAYRTGETEDGYNCVTSRDRATEITLEYDRSGTVAVDSNCNDHLSVGRIVTDEARLWGNQI